jgi:hypothetical protein
MATQPVSPFNPPYANPANIYGTPYAGNQTLLTGQYGNQAVPQGSTGVPTYNTDPNIGVTNILSQNNAETISGAQQINAEAQAEEGYYSPLQQQATTEENAALGQLQQTPGYTAPEASQINVNYGQFNTSAGDLGKEFLTPGETSAIQGDPNAPVQTMTAGTNAEGAQLNAYGANLGGNVNALDTGVGGQLSNYSTNLAGANTNLDTGVVGAANDFGALNAAVGNPALGNQNQEQQLSNQDVQNMETAAGTTVGNMYRTSEDQLQRAAAAAGNTDPLALASANERLDAQSAAGEGDAEVQAQIAAENAQAGRASQIESQRYGEAANTAGLQAGAATTEQAQLQNAAALAGTTDVQSAETMGQAGVNAAETTGLAGINAANTYGAQAINESETAGAQNYNAANTAEQEAAARAANIAGNRQATQTSVNNTEYGQGTNSAQLTAGGATNVGQTRIGGEAAYRAGVAGQQASAQQGGENAVTQQQNAYNTQTTGLNSSGSNRVEEETGNIKGSATNQAASIISAIGKKGAIVTEPTKMMLGEDGPEKVIPLYPPYDRKRQEAA